MFVNFIPQRILTWQYVNKLKEACKFCLYSLVVCEENKADFIFHGLDEQQKKSRLRYVEIVYVYNVVCYRLMAVIKSQQTTWSN